MTVAISEPLDLTSVSTVDWRDFVAETGSRHSPTGEHTYRGVPFHIGARDGSDRVLACGGELRTSPLTYEINKTAHHLVFAHATRSYDDSLDAGATCAVYEFHLSDGTVEAASIRHRLEIGAPDDPWGMQPLLARTDLADRSQPRYDGSWAEAGARQTEVIGGAIEHFYLWVWTNPRPGSTIERLVVRPADLTFVIGGVTAWHSSEPVFPTIARRPIKLDLLLESDAARPFCLEVEVDRGVVTYPQPLPATTAPSFLSGPIAGFGEPPNRSNSPAYVEISATPSATVTVMAGSEVLGAFRYGELDDASEIEAGPRLRVSSVEHGRNWVHTTVVDSDSGRPIPCRIHMRSPDGIPYQPHGHHRHVYSNLPTWNVDVGGDLQIGQVSYAYIDGNCQGWLPRGDVIVDISRGFEYQPLRQKVTIEPGQRELRVELQRAFDPNGDGYYSGDTHVHFLSTQGAHLEAAAEGLNVVNLLMAQWGHLFTSIEEFTGGPDISGDGETIVYVGQENRQHSLGHLALLGLKAPLMPWSTGAPDEAGLGDGLETTLAHWADACHQQGGTVIVPHFPAPEGELPALVATGRVDAVEWIGHSRRQHREYYRYLSLGYRLPLAGGTDKMTSDVAMGLYRTYVRIPEEVPFTYESWCAGLRAGRTFVTGGPMLFLQVEGSYPGDTIRIPEGGATVAVHARVQSVFPVHTLQIIVNGEVVASTESPEGLSELEIDESIVVSKSSWVAARCGGPGYFPARSPDFSPWPEGSGPWEWDRFAHTSPIYVSSGEMWSMFDPDLARPLLPLLEGVVEHIRDHALHWEPGTTTHHHGQPDHLAYLEMPFREAIASIQRRIRGLS